MLSKAHWLHILGCLALDEWSHHRDYPGHEDPFCTVLLCILAIFKCMETFAFFKKFLFLLYFTFQYCIGFAIHWHESTMGVYELPMLNHPPTSTPYHHSGSSPCTSPKYPVSCIEHRLALRFLHDSIHVSMPFSLIIPPSPSPSESKKLFYTSVSLLLSHMQGHHYHHSKFHICVSILYLLTLNQGLNLEKTSWWSSG